RAVGSGGACFAKGSRTESEGPGPTLSTGTRAGEAWQDRRSAKRARTLRRTEEGATGHGGHGHRTRSVRAIQRMRKLQAVVAAAFLLAALSMAITMSGGWILYGTAQTAPKPPAPANQSPAAKPVRSAPKPGARAPAAIPPLFVDVTRAAGIDFHLNCGSKEKLYIVETQCGGAAAFDYNNHDGTFTDVSAKSGLNFCGWGYGVAIGDYDNDGWEDVYITGFHGSALYHNNHDGTFTDVTAKAGVANPGEWGTS